MRIWHVGDNPTSPLKLSYKDPDDVGWDDVKLWKYQSEFTKANPAQHLRTERHSPLMTACMELSLVRRKTAQETVGGHL